MRALLTVWLLSLCAALPLKAEEVVLGLSQRQVSISTDFNGSEILVFGAIKRETAIPEEPLQVIITVAGPNQQLTVRRKSRVFGIWINTAAVEVDAAPSFYAVATSAPWSEVITATEDLRHHVSIPRAIRSVGAPMDVEDSQSFTDAVIRIREKNDAYQTLEGAVDLREDTLFETRIRLPSDLTEGAYPTRIFLTRGGRVVSFFETEIDVRMVGLERWLYMLAHEYAFVYGVMSLAIAVFAGWGASTAFRLIRNN
jgi:uncharacterized protein (TIGR02186 family)